RRGTGQHVAAQVEAFDRCCCRQRSDELARRAPPALRAQIIADALAHRLVGKTAAARALVQADHVYAEASLDRGRTDLPGLQAIENGFELRHRVAARQLTQAAAACSGGASRACPGQRLEAPWILAQLGDRLTHQLPCRIARVLLRRGEDQDVRRLE